MNTQSFLMKFKKGLDIVLDHSEFYDYELMSNNEDESLSIQEVIPIINTTLTQTTEIIQTITLQEIDVTNVISGYSFSNLIFTMSYEDFMSILNKNIIFNNELFKLNINGLSHIFKITNYNEIINLDQLPTEDINIIASYFDLENEVLCNKITNIDNCCNLPPILHKKPWTYTFKTNDCNYIISRRPQLGWSINFVFNRNGLNWGDHIFYYWGGLDYENDQNHYDNALSFKFTEDKKIKWVATRYSGTTVSNNYITSKIIESDETPQLCVNDDFKDFNITIVFERLNFTDDPSKNGGWSKLNGWKKENIVNTNSAVTSTNIFTFECDNETLNDRWLSEKNKRKGILKIFLNGYLLYKNDDWEEVVPSKRSQYNMIQSWGGVTHIDQNHNGITPFLIKKIEYYEEPLDYIQIKNVFKKLSTEYNIELCGSNCIDSVHAIVENPITTEEGDLLVTETNNIIIF